MLAAALRHRLDSLEPKAAGEGVIDVGVLSDAGPAQVMRNGSSGYVMNGSVVAAGRLIRTPLEADRVGEGPPGAPTIHNVDRLDDDRAVVAFAGMPAPADSKPVDSLEYVGVVIVSPCRNMPRLPGDSARFVLAPARSDRARIKS